MASHVVRRVVCISATALALTLPGCAKSQEAKIIAAIEAKYPDGEPRCLGLGTMPGIHVTVQSSERLFYPSTGPTAPTNHLFILYAARSSDPVPELVADLVERRMLTKVTVGATINVETSSLGPQMVSPEGIYYHPTLYAHQTRDFTVDVYETRPFDEAFSYRVQVPSQQFWDSTSSFPSRLYNRPLPPSDQHYAVPTTDPYAISVATSACFKETPDHITAIRIKDAADGGHFMEADVLFAEHSPEWMTTAAFRRAVLGPNTESITKPRLATIVLAMSGDRLSYAYEKDRW